MANYFSDAFYKELGDRVRSRREELRFTQRDLEAKIREIESSSGVSNSYISSLENGKINPTLEVVRLLAAALNTSVGYLVAGNQTVDQQSKADLLTSLQQVADQLTAAVASSTPVGQPPADVLAACRGLSGDLDGPIDWELVKRVVNSAAEVRFGTRAPSRQNSAITK